MSFNVFDEAPENRLVIKEQQMFANKVGPLCAKLTLVAHCIFLMIMLNIFGRDLRIYGVKGGFELMAYSVCIPHAKALLCRSNDIVATRGSETPTSDLQSAYSLSQRIFQVFKSDHTICEFSTRY
jgi:hypothetical protein